MGSHPLYDATFTLYRLSPLYHGKSPLLGNLDLHSRRLRDNLKGDVFRSVQVAEGQTSGSSLGSLKSCTWELLGDEASWERKHQHDNEDEDEISMVGDVTSHEAKGIHIHVQYETAKHDAVLLGDATKKSAVPGFTALPLLFVRMPAAVREALIQYLSTAFDARISPMRLRTGFLTSTMEALLDRTASPQFLHSEALNKGLQLQFSFPSAAPSLKALDVSISKDDIEEFISHGEAIWQAYQQRIATLTAGTKPQRPLAGPFTAALSAYLNHQLTLTLDNPAVVLSRVVCGPFALGSEGKIKVLSSSKETIAFWVSLVKEAEGKGLTAKIEEQPESRRQKQLSENVVEDCSLSPRLPTEPPPPYDLHDPAMLGR